MADRQIFVEGQQLHEEGTEEYFVEGVQVVEDQAAAAAGGTLFSSLTGVGV